MNLSCEAMADWIFQGNPRRYNLDAAVAASREQWWGTPRYRDQMAVGDRVWLQVVGPKDPGIYYVATIVSETYEHPVQPSDPAHFRWRTDIRFDCRLRPPLLRSELLEDVRLGSFRPFRGFQGSNVPVPPDVAAALAARAAPRLEPLPPENR
jgi:predicted RNA-binding protein with PUA-like domain